MTTGNAETDLVDGSLGELSMFHRTFGIYAHGVAIEVFKAPPGWQGRARVFPSPPSLENTWSHATHDQFYCTLDLRQGWNKVLVKCANWNGGWGFALRLGDPDRRLKFAREPGEGR